MDIKTAIEILQQDFDEPIQLAVILGTGMSDIEIPLQDSVDVSFNEIPGLPKPRVSNHAGVFSLGKLYNVPMILQRGRTHLYEGYTSFEIASSVQIMKGLGVQVLICTNAAGSVSKFFKPGDLMIIEDHINLMGTNPLFKIFDENGDPIFLPLSQPYSHRIRKMLLDSAKRARLNTRSGVYAAVTGPIYETPAEVRMLGTLGATAVGMSTVPEVIMANYHKMEVGGISMITNMGASLEDINASAEDIANVVKQNKEKLERVLMGFVKQLAQAI